MFDRVLMPSNTVVSPPKLPEVTRQIVVITDYHPHPAIEDANRAHKSAIALRRSFLEVAEDDDEAAADDEELDDEPRGELNRPQRNGAPIVPSGGDGGGGHAVGGKSVANHSKHL